MIDLTHYLNLHHGLELEPDINLGDRQNENGVVFLAQALYLAELSSTYTSCDFETLFWLIEGLEEAPGLFNRGALDSNQKVKRTISHDNVLSIASLSKRFNTGHAEEIYHYGLTHAFIYNNRFDILKPYTWFRMPFNPGNYSSIARLGGSSIFYLLFFPWYVVNFLIACGKPLGDTTGKLLTFVELYPLRKDKLFGYLWKLFIRKMTAMYGKYFMEEITAIYYKDPNHPVRIAAYHLTISEDA